MTTVFAFAVYQWLTDPDAVLESLRPVIDNHIREQEISTGSVGMEVTFTGPRSDI